MTYNTASPPIGATSLHAAILEEIACQNWAQPVHIAVDELGLVMGTHLGLKRKRNEDRLAVARIQAPNGELYTVAIVCDGVGGSDSGDLAATLAIASIVHQLASQHSRPALDELATTLVKHADSHVRHELQGRGATTLVMLLATAGGLLVCAGVGDSRVYSWDRVGSQFRQVTVDDTIENELKGLPGDHAALLQARGLQGRLSQALGELGRTSDELRVQTFTKSHFSTGVVLGTDGLWRVARDFEAVAANTKMAADVVRRTINLANWAGGVDNSSMIAIEDLERFCRPALTQAAALGAPATVTLWVSATKVRLLSRDLNQAVAEKSGPNSKRPKKTARGKTTRTKGDESQLKLEADTPSEARPKIEVSISDTSDTNK